MRIAQALGALCVLFGLGGAAEAQQANTRDRLLIGSWECDGNKTAQSDRISARFDSTGLMTLTFHGSVQDGQVTMVFVLGGAWRYDAVADQFSETIATARLDDIVVRGQPLQRSQFPGGEAAIVVIEQDFLRTYSQRPLYFTTVTDHVLVMTDEAGEKISCAR